MTPRPRAQPPERTVGDLAPSPRNPRRVAEPRLSELGRSMREFGDLSAVVFNRRTKRLVGGHQRSRHLPADAPVQILRRFEPPTPAGTVALGTVELEGELWLYREVDWPEEKELAGNVRANNPVGEWDDHLLAALLRDVTAGGFDTSLTGFDQDEVAELLAKLVGPDAPGAFPEVDPLNLATEHRCPRCGYEWSGNATPETGATEGVEA